MKSHIISLLNMEYSDSVYAMLDSICKSVQQPVLESYSLTGYMEAASDTTLTAFVKEITNSIADWSEFFSLCGWAAFFGAIFAVIFILFWLLFRRNSDRIRDLSLKWFFIIVWIYGFMVYDIGMCNGQYVSLLTNAPMAMIYAFKIFIFDSDVSEIHEAFHNNWVYSLNFALVHFLAAIISTLFLIKYFGFNILSWLKMKRASCKFAKTVSDTYVFWGFNEQTKYLIEDVRNHYKKEDKRDYRIVLVRTGKGDNDDNLHERTSLARIFEFLAMPTSELEAIQDLHCLTTGSYTDLSNLNADNGLEDIIGAVLKLKSLKKLLKNHTSNKIHMLFLSDDDKENLHEVALLLNDSTIRSFTKVEPARKREVIFYCLARYNSIHRVIEDQYPSKEIKVKVVDSSHFNVEMLKEEPTLLPVNFVDVEADATVSSAFNALVVGFSEVGQDSVRFLYEFGAFVKTGGTYSAATRSEFHLDVVDKDMSDQAGIFMANAPAINLSMPFVENE